jgi:hypothetical protein
MVTCTKTLLITEVGKFFLLKNFRHLSCNFLIYSFHLLVLYFVVGVEENLFDKIEGLAGTQFVGSWILKSRLKSFLIHFSLA